MSYMTTGSLSLLALSLALFSGGKFGVAPVGVHAQDDTQIQQLASPDAASSVNRDAKGGRDAIVLKNVETVTFAFRPRDLTDTTLVMRLPATRSSANTSDRNVRPSDSRKIMIACEPVVSALMDVAKQLPPGRCVT
jgi:hypothetical protein